MTAWLLALILFIVAIFLHKGGKAKGAKIVQMILRVMYLLILGTGFTMLFTSGMLGTDFTLQYILKLVLGIGVIGLLEMILGKTVKHQSTGILWIAFIIVFASTLYLGLTLPMGTSL